MDQRDVALIGLNALTGASTVMGAAGFLPVLLGLSVVEVLAGYGGQHSASPPPLTADQVSGIINKHLLKQDVRDAWTMISPTHDWYTKMTKRAKSGEQFTARDLNEFVVGYQQATGPNSLLLSGLSKLYSPPPNIASTPAVYGMPYLIVGVGLYVQVLQLGIVQTAQAGESVTPGEWEIFLGELRKWEIAIEACDRLADNKAQEAFREEIRQLGGSREPALKPGGPMFEGILQRNEILYHGGASADGMRPAHAAIGELVKIELAVEPFAFGPR